MKHLIIILSPIPILLFLCFTNIQNKKKNDTDFLIEKLYQYRHECLTGEVTYNCDLLIDQIDQLTNKN